MQNIRLKRAYDPPEPSDGRRFLVDRLWPRGMTKEKLALEAWLKEAAPSAELREGYCHDPAKYEEFRRLYLAELREGLAAGVADLATLLAATRAGVVTLVYAAKDEALSHARVLGEFLEANAKGGA